MDKAAFFIQAMKDRKYSKLSWVISAFAVVNTNNQVLSKYDIINNITNYSIVIDDEGKTDNIEGVSGNVPLFNAKDEITLSVGDIPNLKSQIVSTYGRLLFNWLVLVEPFGDKIEYQNKEIKLNDIEKIILSKLTDIPEDNVREPNLIYVDEYIRYAKCVFALTGYSQLFSQSLTEKALTAPPGIAEYKAKLIRENSDKLNNMAVVAEMEKKLIEFDSKYLEGDESEDFLISKKSRDIVRKKRFLMLGAEPGLDGNLINAPLITNSLTEGWDVNKFPDMNNTLRAGSFNRGAQTELGGMTVKRLLRASSNVNMKEVDCGSTLGSPVEVNADTVDQFIGFTVIYRGQQIKINSSEDLTDLMGKTVMLRNPMYCQCKDTDYCETCVGDRLKINPYGLSSAVAAYGDVMLNIFMQAAHSRGLSLAKMDIAKSII